MKYLLGALAILAAFFGFKAQSEKLKRVKKEADEAKSEVKASRAQSEAKKVAKKKAKSKQERVEGMSREDKLNNLRNPNKRL